MRRVIIETVSANGGHLASNLGVVELTVALALAFSPPRDTIVWDVGHQSYPYKLLTGRYPQFSTIRQEGGLAGFPCREESPYDMFTSGHSSASISRRPWVYPRQTTSRTGRAMWWPSSGTGPLQGALPTRA